MQKKRFEFDNYPIIHTPLETIDKLASSDVSISRFGDGEFMLMFNKQGIVFQCYDEFLGRALRYILQNPTEKCIVGLPHPYFYITEDYRDGCEKYVDGVFSDNMMKFRYMSAFDREIEYYDTNFGLYYHHYKKTYSEYDLYYEKVKGIFRGKDILLVTGDREILEYNHNIFKDSGCSVEYVFTESRNSFSKYNSLRTEIVSKCDGRLVILLCGPCASVLSYDLSNNYDIRALDIGHMPKDYNWFKEGIQAYDGDGFYAR